MVFIKTHLHQTATWSTFFDHLIFGVLNIPLRKQSLYTCVLNILCSIFQFLSIRNEHVYISVHHLCL